MKYDSREASRAAKDARLRVAIVGCGIGGVIGALALHQMGIAADVFEQAEEIRGIGAGLQLSANGTKVLLHLGLGEEMKAIVAEPEGKEVRLFSTGQTWKLFDLGATSSTLYGAPYWMVHRGDFHTVLLEAFTRRNAGRLHTNKRCTGYAEGDDSVVISFADGSTFDADVLIAADGVHSVIRRQMKGEDKPRYTGLAAWRGLIPSSLLPARLARNVGTNWIGPKGHVVTYPLRRGELLNFVGITEREGWQVESWTEAGTVEECLADFEGWNDDIHTMIRSLEVPYKWALLGRDPLSSFTSARVALIGDAAHPTLPFLAQGANMAIEDGMIVARCLAAYGPSAALQRYDRARVARTNKIVQGSLDNSLRFHNPALADAEGAAAYVDREWNSNRVEERYAWLFEYDPVRISI